MDRAALITAIVGIVVSGVVGPQITFWTTRRLDRLRFEREDKARQRDEVLKLLDQAATLLSKGPTMIRRLREGGHRSAVDDWAAEVHPLGERLKIRLNPQSGPVIAYQRIVDAFSTVLDANIPVDAAFGTFV